MAEINVMVGIGILSTPYALKEAGWMSMVLMVLFAVICCYTTTLMRYCFESIKGINSYPDIGEVAFGKYSRIIISVSYLHIYLNIENLCAMLVTQQINLS